MKKTKQVRKEIRVTDIPVDIFTKIVKDAKDSMRNQSKQVIYILKQHYNDTSRSI